MRPQRDAARLSRGGVADSAICIARRQEARGDLQRFDLWCGAEPAESCWRKLPRCRGRQSRRCRSLEEPGEPGLQELHRQGPAYDFASGYGGSIASTLEPQNIAQISADSPGTQSTRAVT